ncbi:MAG: Rho termination factor N-terminal domain-containing protein, partial [Acholeplasmatales bacterium]|nr:Rho termination factor N-terminal domain-containing protein [Acholeplasmatales bacterium]
ALPISQGFATLVEVSNEAIKAYPNGKASKPAKVEKVKEVVKPAPKAAPKVEKKVEEKPAAPKKETKVDLDGLTVAELKEMAKDKGLTGYSALKKAELITALKEVL